MASGVDASSSRAGRVGAGSLRAHGFGGAGPTDSGPVAFKIPSPFSLTTAQTNPLAWTYQQGRRNVHGIKVFNSNTSRNDFAITQRRTVSSSRQTLTTTLWKNAIIIRFGTQ